MLAESLAYLLILVSFSLFILCRGAKPGLSKMKTLDSAQVTKVHRKTLPGPQKVGRNFLR